MKTLNDPAEWCTTEPGLYALVHRETQSVYVGSTRSLRKRLRSWRHDVRLGHQVGGRMPSTDPREYEFRVVKVTTGMTTEERNRHETALIRKLKATPGINLVNVSKVYTVNDVELGGVMGSIAFHAERLGVHAGRARYMLGRGCTPEEAFDPAEQAKFGVASEHSMREHALSRMSVRILDGTTPLLMQEVSERLGITIPAVAYRLKRWFPGRDTVQLDELRQKPT
jgi:hypothetical protein